ncbi:hypothetical protein J3Q64DRAFT_1642438 [Phycomyces blakesleeanus]|uniref:Mitochondrial outer membrane protein IML2 n=1 Tax=Phycomyces blakesleeanus TaxID=4837 RepID=A0ABR3AVS4_PHYBL
MFRQQLSHLTKLTTSTLKYASTNTVTLLSMATSTEDPMPSQALINFWIQETQRGLDAFFDDQFETAQIIFVQHVTESPFHAVGYAMIAYVEAMLGFEPEKIANALQLIHTAEAMARQFGKRARRRSWKSKGSTTADDQESSNSISESCKDSAQKKRYFSSRNDQPIDIQYVLLETNCMLMSATIQFLRSSWIEYMKAAYKLRKAYKMYEHLFETLTGQKVLEYAANLKGLRQQKLGPNFVPARRRSDAQGTEPANTDTVSLSSSNTDLGPLNRKKKSESSSRKQSSDPGETAIESGIFFGIGLFSLIFSLLPPKVNKILNTLGFHSSRPFAIHLLQESYYSQGLYSSLSALTLLAYYTNLSLFIHPQLLPRSFSLENARIILNEMKVRYTQGKIWKLLEGKLCKMEGRTRQGVEILRDARRRRQDPDMDSKHDPMVNELAQLQALAVYEMGWGQLFLGDYFQAAETFLRLERMNNWSRAFYHYIATCCIFADEAYDKAATEFLKVPALLDRKRQLGARLLPNEIFAERKIKRWKEKVRELQSTDTNLQSCNSLDGQMLREVAVVHPLWELIYLWNGTSQLTDEILGSMKTRLRSTLLCPTPSSQCVQPSPSERAFLLLLLGVVERELGDFEASAEFLLASVAMEPQVEEDVWIIPYAMYEIAALRCFEPFTPTRAKEAREWIRRSEHFFSKRTTNEASNSNSNSSSTHTPQDQGDADWESRLYVRCQLLLEKLDDMADT